MKNKKEIQKTAGYIIADWQLKIYDEFKKHIETNPKDGEKIPKWYLARIMNGNFNGSIAKLVELCLIIGKVPVIKFS